MEGADLPMSVPKPGPGEQCAPTSPDDEFSGLPPTSKLNIDTPASSILDGRIPVGPSSIAVGHSHESGPEPPSQTTTYRRSLRSDKRRGDTTLLKTFHPDKPSPSAVGTPNTASPSTSTSGHSGPGPNNRLWRSRLPDHLTQDSDKPSSKLPAIATPPIPGSNKGSEYHITQSGGRCGTDTLLSVPNTIPDLPNRWNVGEYANTCVITQELEELIEVIHKAKKADSEWSSKPEGAMVGGAATFLNSARKIAVDLECATHEMQDALKRLLDQMQTGKMTGRSYISYPPKEVVAKESYLVAHLDGSGFEVSLVTFTGKSCYTIKSSKDHVPEGRVSRSWEQLSDALAQAVKDFLQLHEGDLPQNNGWTAQGQFVMVLTHGFHVLHTSPDTSILKGASERFELPTGVDLCKVLQKKLDRHHVSVLVTACVTEAICGLLAMRFLNDGDVQKNILGVAAFGPTTGGAYVQSVSGPTTLPSARPFVVNWGEFIDVDRSLTLTRYDLDLDSDSIEAGLHRFENLVSGEFLGELFRETVLQALDSNHGNVVDYLNFDDEAPIFRRWGIPTSFLSTLIAEGDNVAKLATSLRRVTGRGTLKPDHIRGMRLIADAILERSSRLAGVAVGAMILHSKRLDLSFPPPLQLPTSSSDDKSRESCWMVHRLQRMIKLRHSTLWKVAHTTRMNGSIVIGLCGDLITQNPNFEAGIRRTLRLLKGIGPEGEKRVHFSIIENARALGAALVAMEFEQRQGAQTSSFSESAE